MTIGALLYSGAFVLYALAAVDDVVSISIPCLTSHENLMLESDKLLLLVVTGVIALCSVYIIIISYYTIYTWEPRP